jgi:hypothetical protein
MRSWVVAALLATCLGIPGVASASTLTLTSGTDWTAYTTDPGTAPNPSGPSSLGQAQAVCLNDFFPARCPDAALRWGYAGSGWHAELSSIPDAVWIWAPGITGSTSPADSQYFFSKTLQLAGTPLRGNVAIAADNFARVSVNGVSVGSIGSVTDPGAGSVADGLTTFDIAAHLVTGQNVITVEGGNGLPGFCPGPCTMSDDPAGVVFGATVTYRAPGEKDGTATTLAISPAEPEPRGSMTLTATAENTLLPDNTPAGAVQFLIDGEAVGAPVALNDSGQARLDAVAPLPGAHELRADYLGTDQFAPSSATRPLTVGRAASVTTVTVSPDPTVAGQAASFVATVGSGASGLGTPTGTVQFTEDDGTPIGDPEPLDSSGRATMVASAGAGSYRVHGTYSGDSVFDPSSGAVDQTVHRANTVTRISSSQNPVPAGGTLVLTVTVSVVPPGAVAPFGALQFLVDGAPLGGPIPLQGADGVELTVRVPNTPQTATIMVGYSGDANTNPSVDSLVQAVVPSAAAPPATAPTTPATPASPAHVTARQLGALAGKLKRRLSRQGTAALQGARQNFDATTAGTLEQKVYSPNAPASAVARAGARKRVLIATGRHAFGAPSSAALRLKLTPAGRRAIKRQRSLKLAIVTRFTPATGKPVVDVTRLTAPARRRAKTSRTDRGWTLLAPPRRNH